MKSGPPNTKITIAGQLMLPGPSGEVRIEPGALTVKDGRIASVQTGGLPETFDQGGPDHLITPGWIDAHLHLPQVTCRGAYGKPLLEWLETVVFPAEIRWKDPASVEEDLNRLGKELLASGTTGFVAFSSNHRSATLTALEWASESKFRARIGQAVSDQHLPGPLRLKTHECLRDTEFLLERFPPGQAVEAAVAPRFALSCSVDLLCGCAQLAQTSGAWIETHLAETPAETARANQLHNSRDYTSIYRQSGLLGPRTLLGHGIYLDQGEIQAIRESGSTIVHCPTSNSFLRSGTMPLQRWGEAGLSLALGSDIAGGYELSMVRTARAMLEQTFFSQSAPPAAAQAWWWISGGNAEALGWPDLGCLRPQAQATLLVHRPPKNILHGPRPLEELLWTWRDHWLEAIFLAGKEINPPT